LEKVPQKLYQKTIRNHKLFWQSSRIQNEHTEISSFSIYTNNAQTEKEIRKTIPFTITFKHNEVFWINLTKETNDLFNKKYKPLKRETEEDIRRWKDLPCS
jgi:hypothetical protein